MFRKLTIGLACVVVLPLLASCGGDPAATIAKMQRDRYAYVGTVPFEPPLLYQKEGELVGPDAELAHRIVKKIDEGREIKTGNAVKLTWINRTYPTLLSALTGGELDFVLGVFAIDDSAKKDVSYSTPYYTSEFVVIINPVFKKLEVKDLGSAKIGVREGTGADRLVRAKYKGANVVPFKTLDDAVLALRRSEVETVVDDRLLASYSLATTPGVSHLEILPDVVGTVDCAVVVRKSDKALLDLINGIVDEMKKSGDYARLIEENQGLKYAKEVGDRHRIRLEEEANATRPRNVAISVVREPGFDFDIYKMANLRFEFKNQKTGATVQSSPIGFEGKTGKATAQVPPGDYLLNLQRFNFSASLSIIPDDKDNIPIRIRLTAAGVTVQKG